MHIKEDSIISAKYEQGVLTIKVPFSKKEIPIE
jgi:HSP20 family molecular chaperone IbpA